MSPSGIVFLASSLLLAGCAEAPEATADEPWADNAVNAVDPHHGVSAWVDADRDGCPQSLDCDDEAAGVHPGAEERCNNKDDNCDGAVDNGAEDARTWYPDADSDGYGDPTSPYVSCWAPKGMVSNADDCDDQDDTVSPADREVCDGVDQDCDGVVDDPGGWHADADGDGHGDPNTVADACAVAGDHVASGDDCDDTRAEVNPGQVDDTCNGLDDDCDGVVDTGPWYADADGDGYGDPAAPATLCTGASRYPFDCDDHDAAVHPGAVELADGVDQDCDTRVDEHTGATPCADAAEPFDTYVPDDYPTIQAAITAAAAGDRICVRAGTYPETLDFGGTDVLVYGEGGAAGTTIDATGLPGPAVRFVWGESAAATLQGFTVRGGTGEMEEDDAYSVDVDYCSGSGPPTTFDVWCGGGIYANGASPTLTDLVVIGSTLPDFDAVEGWDGTGPTYNISVGLGAGLCFRDSSSVLQNVDVEQGSAHAGGGVYVGSDAIVSWTQGWLTGNTAAYGGAFYVDSASLELVNVITDANRGDYGASLYSTQSTLSAANVTSYDDESAASAALSVVSTDVDLTNVLVADYTGPTGVDVRSSGYLVNLSYTLVYAAAGTPWLVYDHGAYTDPVGTNGNLSADPRFTSASPDGWPGNDDLTLAPDSPARDAGNPAITDADGSLSDLGGFGGPEGSGW